MITLLHTQMSSEKTVPAENDLQLERLRQKECLFRLSYSEMTSDQTVSDRNEPVTRLKCARNDLSEQCVRSSIRAT